MGYEKISILWIWERIDSSTAGLEGRPVNGVYLCSKRKKSKFCQFKMLKPKWDPYNRHAKQQAEKGMSKAKLDTADKDPYDIAERSHDAKVPRSDIPPEGP